MRQSYIHQLFSEISSKLVCQKCKKKIAIDNLEIKETSDSTCLLEVHCSKCDNIMNISASIETQVTEVGKKMNASSIIQQKSELDVPVSEREVGEVRRQLSSCSNLSSFLRIK